MEDIGVPDSNDIRCIWAKSPVVVDVQSVLEHSPKSLSAVNRERGGKARVNYA